MKFWVYLGLCFLLVPLQTTILGRANTMLVEPDVILVVVCLIGLLTDELEGALMGILLGFIQDLFSAGVAFPNLVTKGVLGILAGLIGRQIVQVSSLVVSMTVILLSSLSGLAFLYLARGHALWDAFLAVPTLLLPQAFLDAILAVGVFWGLRQVAARYYSFQPSVLREDR
jgi:rod shape-determining protein MreD